jgi:hypothetical protein
VDTIHTLASPLIAAAPKNNARPRNFFRNIGNAWPKGYTNRPLGGDIGGEGGWREFADLVTHC